MMKISKIEGDTKLEPHKSWIGTRLGEHIHSIEHLEIFDSELFKNLVDRTIVKSDLRFGIEYPIQSDLYESLRLEKYSETIRLIYQSHSRFSFCVNKNEFIKNFDSFYYPGDDVLVLDGSSQKVVCWIDHEEFVVLPSEVSAALS